MTAILEKIKSKFETIQKFMQFLWKRKLWWLIPILFVFILIGFILVMTAGTGFSLFIYTLF